jgi:hypothetical protein
VWSEIRNFKKCLIQMFMKQVGGHSTNAQLHAACLPGSVPACLPALLAAGCWH